MTVGNTLVGADWAAGVARKGITGYGGHVISQKGNFDGLHRLLGDPQSGGMGKKGKFDAYISDQKMQCGRQFPFLVISQKGNFFVKIFLVWGSKIAFLGNSFFGNFPILEGCSHDLASLFGNFDGLHKRLKNHFGTVFPKKENLMDDISNWWTHIPKKENFDGQHDWSRNHFAPGFPFLEGSSHKNYQKRKF